MRRNHRFVAPLLVVAALLAAGCATSEEWGTWKARSAHFASADHLAFSVRNRAGTAARVSRQDIELARQQGWWGDPITVRQEQVLER
jgi:hypothetical protein